MTIMGSLRALIPFLIGSTPLWACPESPPPVERRQVQKVWQYVWDLPDAAVWLQSESLPLPERLLDYRDFANEQTDTDPFVLLARQRAVFEKAYGPQDGTVKAFRLIESREVGAIGSSTCAELMLMDEHLKFHPNNVPGSEFSARIFRKGSRLKIYAAFIEVPSMAAPGVVMDAAAVEGWEFVAFLHNHPFSFDNQYGDISGTVIPSEPDLMTFRKLFDNESLQGAWITNGLDTARYDAEDAARLIEAQGL